MPIDISETFPFNHAQAVQILKDGDWSQPEQEAILEGGVARLHGALTPALRQCWGLADRTYPLNRYYRRTLGLGNPDDMTNLILREFYAHIGGDSSFSLQHEAAWLKKHWMDQGVDPLTMERAL